MMKQYAHGIHALSNQDQWFKTGLTPIIAPISKRKQPGKPKKLRRREPNETIPQNGKLKKYHSVMTCKNCGQRGHNKRSCLRRQFEAMKKHKNKVIYLNFLLS